MKEGEMNRHEEKRGREEEKCNLLKASNHYGI
jgi:hypothetical protein